MQDFTFIHAGKSGFKERARYRLKECLILSNVIASIWHSKASQVVVHNSVASKRHFSRDFVVSRAKAYGMTNPDLLEWPAMSGLRGVITAILLVVLVILPLRYMRAATRLCLARRRAPLTKCVIFCDAHLSGFILALALQDLGVETATLQHGLYRSDDSGSTMAIRNFVSDEILLWDEVTADVLVKAGHTNDRVRVVGQYGFSHLLARRETPMQTDNIIVCPPYSKDLLPVFQDLATSLPSTFQVGFSLHPILRQQFQELRSEPLSTTSPRPAFAICGDGGAIMDSLACGIPVISVGPRPLAAAHIFLDAELPDNKGWQALQSLASVAQEEDLKRFGFGPRHGARA